MTDSLKRRTKNGLKNCFLGLKRRVEAPFSDVSPLYRAYFAARSDCCFVIPSAVFRGKGGVFRLWKCSFGVQNGSFLELNCHDFFLNTDYSDYSDALRDKEVIK